MKLFIVAFLIPLVYSVPSKRLFIDSIDLFDMDTLKADMQIMIDVLGGDPTEQACEAECTKIIQQGHILNFGCPLVCHGIRSTDISSSEHLTYFQTLVQSFKLTTPAPTGSAAKRLLIDTSSLFDLDTLKADMQIMLDVLGSDPTEAQCEAECHKLLQDGHVLNFGCPLVCHGFQTLAQSFKLTTPAPTMSAGKRLLIDTSSLFDLDTLKADMQIMLDVLGSDPSEAQCEAECHKILQEGHVLNFGCPLVCHGFQTLAQSFKLTTPAPTMSAGKRLLIDTSSLFDLDTLKADMQIMLDVLGSDPTESQCEAECHKILQDGHVLNFGCPLVCHGFQTLAQSFKLTTPAPTMSAGKRLLIDTSSLFDLDTLKADMQIMLDVLGSDPSEVMCEAECHKLLQDGHVLNYGCPLVCHGFQGLVNTFHLTTPAPINV